jgi:hypothetical protein
VLRLAGRIRPPSDKEQSGKPSPDQGAFQPKLIRPLARNFPISPLFALLHASYDKGMLSLEADSGFIEAIH